MTAVETSITKKLAEFVGQQGMTMVSPDPVNAAMIRQWCEALGDTNPVYADKGIAPAAMLQVWTMPGWVPKATGPDAVAELYAYLDSQGYSSIVATNSEQDYFRPLKLGETIKATKTIASISDEKKTALGDGFFITTEIDIVDERGESVGRQLHRVLKFKPPAKDRSTNAPASEQSGARRPRPNVTRDTAFYFEGASRHELLIQRCHDCQWLQHPPWPSCPKCGSFNLGHARMSGRGEVYSYTVVHAPVVPPFKPPYNVVLVRLEEGVNIISELRDVAREDIHIGMKVEVDFVDVDAGMVLPVFRPATGKEKLPPLILPLDRSYIVATALATRDYQPVHHDPDYARRGGSEDIFMNILTSQGLVGRYVIEWAGPDAVLKRTAIRLGVSNYPGDTMVMRGEVQSRKALDNGQEEIEIAVRGTNSLGDHLTGTAVVVAPQKENHP